MDINLTNQILCSAIKIDTRIKYYGSADVFKLSALSMIYNLISCNSGINHEQLTKLKNMAQELIDSSPDICNLRGESITMTGYDDSILPITNNYPPTIEDIDVIFDNGTNIYTFSESQFKNGFTDVDGDLPEIVRIMTLPSTGVLKFNGVLISSGFLFNIGDSSNLTYIRNNNEYEESFIFQTSDNNIINKLFSNMATFTITVDGQINQPPSSVGDGSKTTSYGTPITFTIADFTTNTTPAYADPEGDAASLLKILTLPSDGTLKLNGVDVLVNDEIDFSDIGSGLFTYVPDDGTTTAYTPSFTFSIADAGSGQFTS